MLYSTMPLSDEALHNIELIDHQQKHFAGHEIEKDTVVATKEGNQIICMKPSTANAIGVESTERIFTIKNLQESRVETHRISTVHELAALLNVDLGVSVLYQSQQV